MSPSSGRYQSRILSFVSRQSQRLRDRGTLIARELGDRARWNLKVAATWGAQIVLYPVYAAVQAVRLAGRQLQQTIQEAQKRIRGGRSTPAATPQGVSPAVQAPETPELLPSDTPIQRVLESVAEFPQLAGYELPQLSPVGDRPAPLVVSSRGKMVADPGVPPVISSGGAVVTNPGGTPVSSPEGSVAESGDGPRTSLPVRIRGVASLLENRTLVLVTDDNQILDLLTPEQQAVLRQRIIWEVADYGHQVRLLRQSQPALTPLPVMEDDRPHLLPPVRWFRQFMAWMQTGPVAVSTNLFQESALVPVGMGEGGAPMPQPLLPPEVGQWVDRLWLRVWGNAPSPAPPPMVARLWEDPADPWGDCPPNLQPPQAVLPSQSHDDLLAALPPAPTIRAEAIHHRAQRWFAQQIRQGRAVLVRTESPAPEHKLAAKPAASESGVAETGGVIVRATPETLTRQIPSPRQPVPVSPPTPSGLNARSGKTPAALLGKGKPAPAALQAGSGTIAPVRPATQPQHTPDWIETPATLTGYVKHPLERVLEWVDQALLWLEKTVASLWSLLKKPQR